MPACQKCVTEFEIRTEDKAFYLKIQVPEPVLCPSCRLQRRLTFRNERHLYQRSCDLCHKKFLSIYDQNSPFPVYCYECWWSDKWTPLEYGQNYDSSRPMFDQMKDLFNRVPHLGIVTSHCEKCDYANYTNYSKNCYLIFGSHAAENCYYDWRVHSSLQCIDCTQINKSNYCYECVDCEECYELFFSQDCSQCSNSAFLYDCKGASNCLFSAGLRNKEYCIFNQQYSAQEYEKEKQKLNLGSYKNLAQAEEKFEKFLKSYPRKALVVLNSNNITGDHIVDSKNVHHAFNVKNVYDGAYLESCEDLKDGMDATFSGWPGEIVYECISAGVNVYNTKFCTTCWSCNNIEYCDSCHHSKELFGCFGLHQKNEYCILNKQYNKRDYGELKKQIVADMTIRKEYGEFFPIELSAFSYNESIANEYFPLTKEEALKQDFKWKNDNPKNYQPQIYTLPDKIEDVPDAIIKEIFACGECGKNYKIIIQELEFYKKFQLPIPRNCFSCRHQTRMNQRNGRILHKRTCSKCNKEIPSTYNPDRQEKIYCEECYLKEVY